MSKRKKSIQTLAQPFRATWRTIFRKLIAAMITNNGFAEVFSIDACNNRTQSAKTRLQGIEYYGQPDDMRWPLPITPFSIIVIAYWSHSKWKRFPQLLRLRSLSKFSVGGDATPQEYKSTTFRRTYNNVSIVDTWGAVATIGCNQWNDFSIAPKWNDYSFRSSMNGKSFSS